MESNSACNHTSDEHEVGVRFVNHEYDYRQNWMTVQLIITISISIVFSGDSVFCLKFLYFRNPPVFLWIRGCCYGYFDHFCD